MWLPKFWRRRRFLAKRQSVLLFAYEKPHQITPNDPRFVTCRRARAHGDFSQSINSERRKCLFAIR
jgi:hypothetical protein